MITSRNRIYMKLYEYVTFQKQNHKKLHTLKAIDWGVLILAVWVSILLSESVSPWISRDLTWQLSSTMVEIFTCYHRPTEQNGHQKLTGFRWARSCPRSRPKDPLKSCRSDGYWWFLYGFGCENSYRINWHNHGKSPVLIGKSTIHGPFSISIYIWLVVDLPLWKIWVRQLGWWHSQYLEKECSKPPTRWCNHHWPSLTIIIPSLYNHH